MVSVVLALVTMLVVVSVFPHTGSVFASAGRIPICDLKGNCDEQVEENDPTKVSEVDLSASRGAPVFRVPRRSRARTPSSDESGGGTAAVRGRSVGRERDARIPTHDHLGHLGTLRRARTQT